MSDDLLRESHAPLRTRYKFRCNSVTKRPGWADQPFVFDVRFSAVTGGSDENDAFWAATPGGELTLISLRTDQFVPGKEYYLDISQAAE